VGLAKENRSEWEVAVCKPFPTGCQQAAPIVEIRNTGNPLRYAESFRLPKKHFPLVNASPRAVPDLAPGQPRQAT